ncbi:MAG TPA: hypothetical protein VFU14_16320 [Acidimicrobiales bacterium]|nr:hypothetical protein [Acidimicrobiales bacterium]
MNEDLNGSAASDPGAPPRRWTVVLGALAVAAIVIATAAWGVVQRGDATDAKGELARQRDAVLVASGFVEALLSYDFEDLDAQQAAVERFATEEFRSDFTEAFTDEVRDEILAEQASATATVEDVYVAGSEADEARAIVHATSKVSSRGGASAELESYLQVRLVRLGARWRVGDLTSLGSRDLSAPLPTPEAREGGEEAG